MNITQIHIIAEAMSTAGVGITLYKKLPDGKIEEFLS